MNLGFGPPPCVAIRKHARAISVPLLAVAGYWTINHLIRHSLRGPVSLSRFLSTTAIVPPINIHFLLAIARLLKLAADSKRRFRAFALPRRVYRRCSMRREKSQRAWTLAIWNRLPGLWHRIRASRQVTRAAPEYDWHVVPASHPIASVPKRARVNIYSLRYFEPRLKRSRVECTALVFTHADENSIGRILFDLL